MSHQVLPTDRLASIDKSIYDLYLRVIRELRVVRELQVLQSFDPAPWKTQLDSLAALVSSIRIALLTRLLLRTHDTGFRPITHVLPLQGFFQCRVNKRNAP